VDTLNLKSKEGFKIFTFKQNAEFSSTKHFINNNPFILFEKIEKEEKDIRVIKETVQRRRKSDIIKRGINPDLIEMFDLKIIREIDKNKSYHPIFWSNLERYFLCKTVPKNPRSPNLSMRIMADIPWHHKLQMDWNNDEIRLFGPKSDGEWIKIDLSKTGKWESLLRKRKKGVLRKHWFRTMEEFS
jgi:hypothetical protein